MNGLTGITLSVLLAGAVLSSSSAFGQSSDTRSPAATVVQQPGQSETEGLAEAIVAREEIHAGRRFDAQFRVAVKDALSLRSPAELATITDGLGTSTFGDPAVDLVYTPVVPCRVIDTRNAGGRITAGQRRDFRVTGAGFAGQGGFAGNCNIPVGRATAVTVNFVAVDPDGAGNLRAFPFPAPEPLPTASIVNYARVSGLNFANGVAVPICNPQAVSCPMDLTIQADVAGVDLVADVLGFYSAPFPLGDTGVGPINMSAVVRANGTLARTIGALNSGQVSGGEAGLVGYQVIFNRNVTQCTFVAAIGSAAAGMPSPGQISVASRTGNPNAIFIQPTDPDGSVMSSDFHVFLQCPR